MLSLIQVTYSSLFLIHIARCWAQVSRTAHDQATPQTTGTTRPSKARMRFLRRQNAFQDICPKVNGESELCLASRFGLLILPPQTFPWSAPAMMFVSVQLRTVTFISVAARGGATVFPTQLVSTQVFHSRLPHQILSL